MPRRLLDPLTKMESFRILLWSNNSLEWLVLDEVDCLLEEAALVGRWSRLPSGFAGAAADWWWGVGAAKAFRSMLVLATETSKLE
jgi:hypothetical protein